MKKVIDYFDFSSNCIFSEFLAPVWVYAFPDTAELDKYFLINYGSRPAFDTMLDKFANDSGKITGNNLKALADMLYHINGKKWEHLFAVYNADYSPLENTDVYESTKEVVNSNGEVVTDSDTSYKPDSSIENKKAGFNNSAYENDTKAITTGTDVTEVDNTVTSEANRVSEFEHRKHGNIGITENTTMLQHEVEFWKWSFIDSICKDICDNIALSIY